MASYRQVGTPHAAVEITIRIPGNHHQHLIRRQARISRLLLISRAAFFLAILLTLFSTFKFYQLPELRSRLDEDDVKSKYEQLLQPLRNQSLEQKDLDFGHGSGTIGGDSRRDEEDTRNPEDDGGKDQHPVERAQPDIIELTERDYETKGTLMEGDDAEEEDDALDKKDDDDDDDILEELYYEKMGLDLWGNRIHKYEEDIHTRNPEDDGGKDRHPVDIIELRNKTMWREGDDVEEADAVDEEGDDDIDTQDDHYEAKQDDVLRIDDGGDHGDLKLGSSGLGTKKIDESRKEPEKGSSELSGNSTAGTKMDHTVVGRESVKLSNPKTKSGSKKKPKHQKSPSVSCNMKFLGSEAQLEEPLENKKFSRFALQYTDAEDRPGESENWEPRFAGHQTLQEREESFNARDQKINCGFIKCPNGSPSTGFDLAEDDVKFMSTCHIVVSSAIFGNSDHIREPSIKKLTKQSKKNVCFIMFVDETTSQTLSSEGHKMDAKGFIGLWKMVVVKNLPYTDMRRVGKIPKFLSHQLFPSARYSIWLDSKLRLETDPYHILEYFLWRRDSEYAISNHYDRHCVWDEVKQNKKLNKFNHTIIDRQFKFYQADGLKRFDPSDTNKLLPSYVPEGSFIVREHTPMSNLFSCLWFNEVDRFTPRDQLSFAYTYLKLGRMNPQKPFRLHMFKDCERRSVTKLFRHRSEEKLDTTKRPNG